MKNIYFGQRYLIYIGEKSENFVSQDAKFVKMDKKIDLYDTILLLKPMGLIIPEVNDLGKCEKGGIV